MMTKYCLGLAALLLALAGYLLVPGTEQEWKPENVLLPEPAKAPVAATADEVHRFCTLCHAYPPAETFPQAHWQLEVRKAYDFFRTSKYRVDAPDMEGVIEYYRQRAPKKLPPSVKCPLAADSMAGQYRQVQLTPAGAPPIAKVTNVQLAHLCADDKLDVLVCQNDPGRVWALKLYDNPPSWNLLAEVLAPCHVEVVDLDGDGILDVVVADLGNSVPANDRTGRVVWLRGQGASRFTPITLLDGVGRVADVRVHDFNGDGKLDLVVAVFGWQKGEILYLENRTVDWNKPVFAPIALDSRSGTIHVEVGDINRDGHLDVVALLSQEHETIVAFLGDGKGGFTKETIYNGPHPAYGSSGIQLVDLDGDGDLDVLYTNGDTLDPPLLLKPYHGIQWLENRGEFPFVHHWLTAQYGVMRAVAVRGDGDGQRDIVCVAFLPPQLLPDAKAIGAESVQILRQVAPGKFERHVLARGHCQHLTCDAGDVYGDGRTHIVVGNFFITPAGAHGDLLTVWKNLGRKQ
jgi:hypothetical protein